MTGQTLAITRPAEWGFLDIIHVSRAGIVRLQGWSLEDRPEVPLVQGADHLWTLRYHREDLPQRYAAGVFFEYRVAQDTREIVIPLADGPLAVNVGTISPPAYSQLLAEPRVFHREDIYGTGPSVTFVDAQVAALARIIEGSALDFGCGSGALVQHLRGRDIDIRGIDLDTPSIRRDVLPEARDAISFYPGDVLPFADKSFRWTTACEVMEHIPDYERAISEIARVSDNLLMTVPDATAIPRLSTVGLIPWHMLEATHVNFFTPANLRPLLSRYFEDVELGQMHHVSTYDHAWSVNLFAVARRSKS